MNPGGRLWRVDLAAVIVATMVVGMFVLTMAVEQILPSVGAADAQGGPGTRGGTTAAPDCTRGRVALTFDGGPDPEVTGALLDVLRDERVLATFFVAADRAARDIKLVQRMAAAGHQVGLFVPPLGTGGDRRMQIAQGRDLFIRNGLGVPRLLRPDNGIVDQELRDIASAAGMTVAVDPGSLDIGDREVAAPRTLQQRIMDGVATHKVLVAHDTSLAGLNTVAAMTPTLGDVRGHGFCFARLDDVKDGRGVIVVSGGEPIGGRS